MQGIGKSDYEVNRGGLPVYSSLFCYVEIKLIKKMPCIV